jgi:Ca-activated chloride channel family protein
MICRLSKITPLILLPILLTGCNLFKTSSVVDNNQLSGIEIKFLMGSDLGEFCRQTAEKLNSTKPKLNSGQSFYLTCDAKGSGDVINEIISLSEQLSNGSLNNNDPLFPSLIAVDGEIYQNQLIYQVDKIFPQQNYIPAITDTPLLVFSPMVFITTKELAPALAKTGNIYTALSKYDNYQQLDPNATPLPIHFVQTAPTRSNSGLQTLVAQFASLANKPSQDLTIDDIKKYQDQIKAIQTKVTRYGASTSTLANSMVENGIFWANVGSVYESLVIRANEQGNQSNYQAIYPQATFSSNIRGIIPNTPWMSPEEKEAAQKVLDFMLTPESQQLATQLGLRPGVPGIPLGDKFSPQFGVQANPTYESYRSPKPEVVEAMLKSWQEYAKKPSQVVIVVDISGSMEGEKMTAMQSTLFTYINNLGLKEEVALITFSSEINQPVIIKGTPESKNQGIKYISSLQANGGTSLYDSALYARNWLKQNLKPDAINAVLILTDGQDSGKGITLEQLKQQLGESGFNSDERIAFFTIGYGEEGEFNAEVLETIASLNSGYYRKGNPSTIDQVMTDLQFEF